MCWICIFVAYAAAAGACIEDTRVCEASDYCRKKMHGKNIVGQGSSRRKMGYAEEDVPFFFVGALRSFCRSDVLRPQFCAAPARGIPQSPKVWQVCDTGLLNASTEIFACPIPLLVRKRETKMETHRPKEDLPLCSRCYCTGASDGCPTLLQNMLRILASKYQYRRARCCRRRLCHFVVEKAQAAAAAEAERVRAERERLEAVSRARAAAQKTRGERILVAFDRVDPPPPPPPVLHTLFCFELASYGGKGVVPFVPCRNRVLKFDMCGVIVIMQGFACPGRASRSLLVKVS